MEGAKLDYPPLRDSSSYIAGELPIVSNAGHPLTPRLNSILYDNSCL